MAATFSPDELPLLRINKYPGMCFIYISAMIKHMKKKVVNETQQKTFLLVAGKAMTKEEKNEEEKW